MERIYKWVDGFDGGENSDGFSTVEEAVNAMKEHCAKIRLTRSELEKLQKKHEDYVTLCAFDEDNNIIDTCIDSITISEDTALIF